MKLLVFAHRGEAQTFFNEYNFTPVEFFFSGLFQSRNFYLLITGEGMKDAGEKTTAVLARYYEEIDEIINIGIAGSLNPKIKKGDLIWVRSSYAQNAERCEFKSFSTKDHSNRDCISAFNRTTTYEEKEQLMPFADLIDRELWSIMSAAHLFKKNARSLKIISDELSDTDFCKLVKEEAPQYSKALFLEFNKKINTSTALPVKKNDSIDGEDFFLNHPKLYFTSAQKRKLHSLLHQIHVKKIFPLDNVVQILDLVLHQDTSEKSPKEYTKVFLSSLTEKTNPLNTIIKEKITDALKPFSEAGIAAHYDPELEEDYIQINYQIRSTKDQKRLMLALEQFNYQKIKNIFSGILDNDL